MNNTYEIKLVAGGLVRIVFKTNNVEISWNSKRSTTREVSIFYNTISGVNYSEIDERKNQIGNVLVCGIILAIFIGYMMAGGFFTGLGMALVLGAPILFIRKAAIESGSRVVLNIKYSGANFTISAKLSEADKVRQVKAELDRLSNFQNTIISNSI